MTVRGAAALKTPEYNAWRSMKRRCLSESCKTYYRYGGRGITVCERWLKSFENFFMDMGPRPSPAHSVGRIDNDGPYSPENCRWETVEQQCSNTRRSKRIAHGGITLTYGEWAKRLGLPLWVIYHRINRSGWSVERALSDKKVRSRAERNNRLVTAFGETRCVTEWAEKYGLNMQTLQSRMRRGMDLERALTVPVRPMARKQGDIRG